MKEGWILLFKKFLNWEWYDHPPTKDIFLHCLLSANFTDETWKGQLIKRGQLITSIERLAILNGLTSQQTRTALKNLQTTNEINIQTTNRYSIITVNNYDLYQPNNKRKTGGLQQTNNTQPNKQNGGSNNNTINNKMNKNNKITHTNNIEKEKKSVCDFSEISEEDLNLLTNYAKKSKVRNLQAYIHTLIKNGGYKSIIEAEKKNIKKENKKREDKANEIKENFKMVNSKYKAAIFIGMYGDFTDENHPEEVKQLMEEYNIPSFTEAVRYQHEHKD